jgi:hypothetical protein
VAQAAEVRAKREPAMFYRRIEIKRGTSFRQVAMAVAQDDGAKIYRRLQQRSVSREHFNMIDHEGVNLGILLDQFQANLLFQGTGQRR